MELDYCKEIFTRLWVGWSEIKKINKMSKGIEFEEFLKKTFAHWPKFITIFLPVFREETPIRAVDHFVLNYPVGVSENVARYYFRVFGLEEIWYV